MVPVAVRWRCGDGYEQWRERSSAGHWEVVMAVMNSVRMLMAVIKEGAGWFTTR